MGKFVSLRDDVSFKYLFLQDQHRTAGQGVGTLGQKEPVLSGKAVHGGAAQGRTLRASEEMYLYQYTGL